MPKKERAEGKADRATSKQAEASTKASKVAEDQFWDDAGEGKTKSKAKAAAKKDDADAAAQVCPTRLYHVLERLIFLRSRSNRRSGT